MKEFLVTWSTIFVCLAGVLAVIGGAMAGLAWIAGQMPNVPAAVAVIMGGTLLPCSFILTSQFIREEKAKERKRKNK